MSEKELLEETQDSEQNSSSDESQEEVGSDTDQKKSEKKFDVWKEYKKLKKENKILKMTALEEDDDEELEQEQEVKEDKSLNEVKFDMFLLKNAEAEEYKEEMKTTMSKFPNMSYEEAFAFSKANYTKSKSVKDFSTNSVTPKKELKDYTKEEVLAMKDRKKLLEWSRLNGEIS